mmetsp:Transcript_5898/g.11987  ORF Transcript_5898/g.11987 Transcript_5898/m.11987 type:complete len:87 (+) Transcript_5898:24-284(+)
MDPSSYDFFSEQLVSLKIDIDDKFKVSILLEHNIEKERRQIAFLETSRKNELKIISDAEVIKHGQIINHISTSSQEVTVIFEASTR